jgi:predicted N-acetyltransferase YhbS
MTTTAHKTGRTLPYPPLLPVTDTLARCSVLGKRALFSLLRLAARVQTLDLQVKIADSEAEYEQIAELNHQTYVDELRQDSAPRSQRRLVDKYHDTNVYLVAKRGDEVIGMIFITLPQHPFSIEESLTDTSALAGIRHQTVELRRLAVKKQYRRGRIMLRLFEFGFRYYDARGMHYAIISALDQQRRLYKKLGAWDIGAPFTKGECTYYPMMMSSAVVRSPQVDKTELRI